MTFKEYLQDYLSETKNKPSTKAKVIKVSGTLSNARCYTVGVDGMDKGKPIYSTSTRAPYFLGYLASKCKEGDIIKIEYDKGMDAGYYRIDRRFWK